MTLAVLLLLAGVVLMVAMLLSLPPAGALLLRLLPIPASLLTAALPLSPTGRFLYLTHDSHDIDTFGSSGLGCY